MTTQLLPFGPVPTNDCIGAILSGRMGDFFSPRPDVASLSDEGLCAELLSIVSSNAQPIRCVKEAASPVPIDVEQAHALTHVLALTREIHCRILARQMKGGFVFSSPQAVREWLTLHCMSLGYEVFIVMYLDACNRLIAAEELFRGTINQTSVYPREVVKSALAHKNATAIIGAHNHPSGSAEPSRSDELITRDLKDALALVDIKMLDHMIVAGPEVVSMAERGLI